MEVGLGVNFTGSARAEDLASYNRTNLQFYDVASGRNSIAFSYASYKTVYYVSDTDFSDWL
jgi:hypothetical protein